MIKQQRINIALKRKMVNYNSKDQDFRLPRARKEKFLLAKPENTIKEPIAGIDRGKCNSRNSLGVVVEVDSSKCLCKKLEQ